MRDSTPASRPSRCWTERRATARRSCTVLSAATGSSRVCATCPRTATGARQRSLDQAPRPHPWRRLRRARTGDATVREPRGRRPSHAGGPQRLLLLRLLEAGWQKRNSGPPVRSVHGLNRCDRTGRRYATLSAITYWPAALSSLAVLPLLSLLCVGRYRRRLVWRHRCA